MWLFLLFGVFGIEASPVGLAGPSTEGDFILGIDPVHHVSMVRGLMLSGGDFRIP